MTNIEDKIKAIIITDLQELGWSFDAIAHIMGHKESTQDELEKALEIRSWRDKVFPLQKDMPEAHKELGRRVKYMRKTTGLTQAELAKILGISKSHMGHIEQGKREPSVEILWKLSDTLDIRAKDLIPF